MLATAGPLPLDDSAWGFEMKWDGVRALLEVRDGRVVVLSRIGRDVTDRYPELQGVADALGGTPAVLDGEIVVLDPSGRPSFEALQRHDRAAVVMLFDVLSLHDELVVERPYVERRSLLERLGLDGPHWQTPPWRSGDGRGALDIARRLGLEGVVGKRRDSRYEPGRRSSAWRKVKLVRRQELVVGGWLQGAGRLEGHLGSLLVGVHDGPDGPLRYAGRVGSGIDERARTELERGFAQIARDTSPFEPAPRRLPSPHWVQPETVVEVRFTEWTAAGLLRQPSYLGTLDDHDPAAVVREATP